MGIMHNRRYNFVSMGEQYMLDGNDNNIPVTSQNEDMSNDGSFLLSNCGSWDVPTENEDGTPHIWQTWKDYQTIPGVAIPFVELPGDGNDLQLFDPFNAGPTQAVYSGPALSLGSSTYSIGMLDLDESHPVLLFKTTPWYGRVMGGDSNAYQQQIAVIEQPFLQEIKIWPNPASQTITISVAPYDAEFSTRIRIVDIQGREVLTTTLTAKLGTVDVSELETGTYMIHIVSGNHTKWIKFQRS